MIPGKNAPSDADQADITDPAATADLLPAVYEELRRVAAGYMRDERAHHTLQPTALVHEAYLRLLEQDQVQWQNRSHFLGMAARTMRRILTNYAIARTREKRGGKDSIRVTLDEGLDFYDQRDISLTAVDEALRALEVLDPRQGRIVELRFFGGMTVEEIAALLEISSATVKREWATAKLWLRQEISASA
ncbi:MAG TPA: sigma-70 family RNA polymerase sigma factor [Chthoniobacterales bacterium]|nr:sigma-70 family RNA polymerase sigma factor [Chthoniobacterales bacterium]